MVKISSTLLEKKNSLSRSSNAWTWWFTLATFRRQHAVLTPSSTGRTYSLKSSSLRATSRKTTAWKHPSCVIERLLLCPGSSLGSQTSSCFQCGNSLQLCSRPWTNVSSAPKRMSNSGSPTRRRKRIRKFMRERERYSRKLLSRCLIWALSSDLKAAESVKRRFKRRRGLLQRAHHQES